MTKSFLPLSGLGQIADQYDAIFCDIWGVIHNGKVPFIAACEALERFRERAPVVLITNSPRPSMTIPASFELLNVPGEFYDAIVTSGDATIDELARRAPGPAFKIGPERDDALYAGLELNFTDLDSAEFISCTGMFDDDEHPDDYTELLGEARERNIPLVCANPDIKVKVGDKIVWCGGALAKMYEDMGGPVVYAGKPHAPIYRLCRAWLDEVTGHVPPPERILCIGDNIFTDLVGAQAHGHDCLFIQDGLYGETERKFKMLMEQHGITARYVAPHLSW
ncbi:TIGR01459 family HAD-type hydrolase [Litorimonas sp. WD9-15]|uniref:TIGR01459 family HAD-type hydrolase n=1 Tax=Litorimonas sp. WD9-15 TaxID=3418716 RepID=UPI003D082F21